MSDGTEASSATEHPLLIAWNGDRPATVPNLAGIIANLSTPSKTPIALAYRRSASSSRGKEARAAYQKQRSQADRDLLKQLKSDPEAYARLREQVRREKGLG